MKILDEIQEHFAALSVNDTAFYFRELEETPADYPSYSVKMDSWFGVAIPYPEDKEYNASFTGCRYLTRMLSIEKGPEKNYLLLLSNRKTLRQEFAYICSQFLYPGEQGEAREKLLDDPELWWNNWSALLGNTLERKETSSIVAEMFVLLELRKRGLNPMWTAASQGSRDIEINDHAFEVKSTLLRYGHQVSISGVHQLIPDGKTDIVFIRLERADRGYSIANLSESLIETGYDRFRLEDEIGTMGYGKETSEKNKSYRVLEAVVYNVNKNFPVVSWASFKDNTLPDRVLNIQYTLDLEGYPNENF